jgi:hypothetical protein
MSMIVVMKTYLMVLFLPLLLSFNYANAGVVASEVKCESYVDNFLNDYLYSNYRDKVGINKWLRPINYRVVSFVDDMPKGIIEGFVEMKTRWAEKNLNLSFRKFDDPNSPEINTILIFVDSVEKFKTVLFQKDAVNIFGGAGQSYDDYISEIKDSIDLAFSGGIFVNRLSSDVDCCAAASLALIGKGNDIENSIEQIIISLLIDRNKRRGVRNFDIYNESNEEAFDYIDREVLKAFYSDGLSHRDPISKLTESVSYSVKREICN